MVDQVGLGQLRTDLVERVQRSKSVLEDHRHGAAAQLAQLVLRQVDDLGAADPDGTGDLGGLAVVQPQHRHAGDRLARSGLTHDPEGLAELDRVGEVGDRLDESVSRREADGELLDLEEGVPLGQGVAGRAHHSLTLGSRKL